MLYDLSFDSSVLFYDWYGSIGCNFERYGLHSGLHISPRLYMVGSRPQTIHTYSYVNRVGMEHIP